MQLPTKYLLLFSSLAICFGSALADKLTIINDSAAAPTANVLIKIFSGLTGTTCYINVIRPGEKVDIGLADLTSFDSECANTKFQDVSVELYPVDSAHSGICNWNVSQPLSAQVKVAIDNQGVVNFSHSVNVSCH